MFTPGETRTASQLGLVSRRTAIRAGAALVAGAGLAIAGGPIAAQSATGARVRNLTGAAETGRFSAGYTDLAIPVQCPNGTLLYVCGDTFTDRVGGADWRAPVGLAPARRT